MQLKNRLAAAGITAPHAIAEIAKFCDVPPSTVWRCAVGESHWQRVRPMVVRSLLQIGWKPKGTDRATVKHWLAHLDEKNAGRWPTGKSSR